MISVKDLSFTYPNSSEQVLKSINFDIKEGEIFGFLGPSGSGKSTTQKILYKILSSYKGQVIIDGKLLGEWGSEFLERVGVGFEMPNHYLKLTGRENLELFGNFYKKRNLKNKEELFRRVGLESAIDAKVETYSKGMKMRLNFIRAIQHSPDILFFDEPTAGLDPMNARKLKDYILELKMEGRTIFITTHNMTTADELCDRVAFIESGKLLVEDSPKKLKKKYGKEGVKVILENRVEKEFPLLDLGSNLDFLNFIKSSKIESIRTLEASLEEVFIQVTGKELLV